MLLQLLGYTKFLNNDSKDDGTIGHQKVLVHQPTESSQKPTVYQYLDRLDQLGVPARYPMLVDCVNLILKQHHEDSDILAPAVGPKWPKRFLSRYPEYTI